MSRLFRFKTTLTTVCLLALPTVVWAAGAGSGRSPWADLGFKAINFSILVGGLFFILRKPIAQALRDRHEGVRKALEDARKAKEEADAKAAEYAQRVANLDQEVEEIRSQVQAEAERQKEQILADAKAAAESIRRQAVDYGIVY